MPRRKGQATLFRRLEFKYYMRNIYWSDTKFARWFRKYDKPFAATADEWNEWHEQTKKAYPVRYFLTENVLNRIQDVFYYIPDAVHKVFYWYNNRFVEQRHVLRTGLPKGEWHEFETRLLHGAFNELVEFVEVEKAFHYVAHDKVAREEYKPPWWRFGKFGFYFRGWRCPEAGIEYLLWESNMSRNPRFPKAAMVPEHQAEAAEETLYLYLWWKNRKYRPDPSEESDLYHFLDTVPSSTKKWSPAQHADWTTRNQKAMELEQKYFDEDTEMLTRLIKVRNSLWT